MGYSLSERARQEFIDIYNYGLREFGHDQAERYAAGLRAAFAFLAEYPRAARLRTEIAPPVRIFPFGEHLILYMESEGEVLIQRLRHGHENWIEAGIDD